MQVLVTGGSGVLGAATVVALRRHGHAVRIYARRASKRAAQWPQDVTCVDGDIADEAALTEAMAGCGAVLHIAGIVAETGDATFEQVNVNGTRAVLAAAEQAGVKRVVYVSSLGAERGTSDYHASKRAAEALVQEFSGEWVVLRPGNVYGPGDQVISVLLKMARTVSAIPAIDGGDQVFQPIWVEDVAEALAGAVEQPEVNRRVFELVGPDTATMNELAERLGRLTGRAVPAVPVPGFVALIGARVLNLLGIHAQLDRGQLQMLEDGNTVSPGEASSLESVFKVKPTRLDEGLQRLADATPEQTIEGGVGSLIWRHVWVDIVDSQLERAALFDHFRTHFAELTPWQVGVGVEPGSEVEVRYGVTLTMSLPLRGNVQVRVVALDAFSLALATLEGHALAGIVRFSLEQPEPHRMRFHVEVHDRPATVVDWLAMSTAGGAIQLATWRKTAKNLLEASGGSSPEGVQSESRALRGEEAERAEAWAKDLVDVHLRGVHERGGSEASTSGPRG